MRPTLLMRSRILSTLGLITIAGAVTACEPNPAPTTEGAVEEGTGTAAQQTVGDEQPTTLNSDPIPTTNRPSVEDFDPDEFDMPSCPSGDFCMTSAESQNIAREGGTPNGDCADIDLGHPNHPMGQGLPHGDWVETRFSQRITDERSTAEQALCCYTWLEPCPGGRPMLDHGEPMLAPLQPRGDWSRRTAMRSGTPRLSPSDRQWVADKWQRDAQYEHSSVASFARTALELLALGAPPELVAGCNQAALDEIKHAQTCFGVASSLSGQVVGPGPIGVPGHREATLAELAVEAFVEGCAGEAFAVLSMHRALARGADPVVEQILRDISADEMEHALLGWQIVAWAITQDPESVRPALEGAAADLGASLHSIGTIGDEGSAAKVPPDHVLRRFGCLPPALYADVRRDAWNETIAPALGTLLAATNRASL